MTDPDILARLERLEALVGRLASGTADMLTPALRRAAGGQWFTAGEAWRLAQSQAEAARATGEPHPELAEALDAEGIRSSHGLGRWLASKDGAGLERGGVDRGGTLWRVPD